MPPLTKLPYLIESSLVLAIGYFVYRLFFAQDKLFIRNRIYLLSLILLSILLPIIHIPVFAREVIFKVSQPDSAIASDIAQPSATFGNALMLIYILVLSLLTIRLMWHLYGMIMKLRQAQKIKVGELDCYIMDYLGSPASIFNKLILTSTNTPQQIIDHEKVHIQHGHSFDVFFVEICKVIWWFNPVIYHIAKSLKENHEYTADHIVASKLENKFEYTEILLRFAKSTNQHSLLNTFSSITKKRIVMLNRTNTSQGWKSLLIIPILLGVVSLFAFDTYNVPVYPENTLLVDTIPGVRIDTIVTFDYDTGKESISIEKVYTNDIIDVIDTIVVFDRETQEEKVQMVRSSSPRTEIIEETFTSNEYNSRTGNMEVRKYKRFPQQLVEVTDTVVTFDYNTFEEKVQIVKSNRPKEELISKEIIERKDVPKGQRFDNVENKEKKSITKIKGIK